MKEYIDRNELLKTINENVAEAHNERCSQLLEAILNAPPADVVEVRHGEYSQSDEYTEQYGWLYKCSCCGVLGWVDNYCGNCGAKMDEERKENER